MLGSTSKKLPEYFGITVGKTPAGGSPAPVDGTYPGLAISSVHKNKRYSVGGFSVTLTNNRTRGTFTGTLATDGSTVTGSFRCK